MTDRGVVEHAFGYFERIYCINLDTRRDKWREVSAEFARVGVLDRVERFPGIVPPSRDGALGCRLSHEALLRRAEQEGASNILVFEDDVVFSKDTLAVLPHAVNALRRRQWEMFYLGLSLMGMPVQVARHLLRVPQALATHAVAYDRSVFDVILGGISSLPDRGPTAKRAIDSWYRRTIHPRQRTFCTFPMLCNQSANRSDVTGRVKPAGFFIDQCWTKFTRHLSAP